MLCSVCMKFNKDDQNFFHINFEHLFETDLRSDETVVIFIATNSFLTNTLKDKKTLFS